MTVNVTLTANEATFVSNVTPNSGPVLAATDTFEFTTVDERWEAAEELACVPEGSK